jgi:hypothetical protein
MKRTGDSFKNKGIAAEEKRREDMIGDPKLVAIRQNRRWARNPKKK